MANLSSDDIKEILKAFKRRKVFWELMIGTILTNLSDDATMVVSVLLDGDTQPINAQVINLSAWTADARVFIAFVPPTGYYVIGMAQPNPMLLGIPAAPSTSTGNGTPAGATEIIDDGLPPYVFKSLAGVRYRVTLTGRSCAGGVAGDRGDLRLRYTTDSSVPTISDTLVGNDKPFGVVPVTFEVGHNTTFVPGAADECTIAAFWIRLSGTGTMTPSGGCQLYAEPIGYV